MDDWSNVDFKAPSVGARPERALGDEPARRRSDHLFVVSRYDIGSRCVHGFDHEGAASVYVVDPDSFARAQKRLQSFADSDGAPYRSHVIDADMAKALPPGKMLVAENARLVAAHSGARRYEVSRIGNAVAQSSDKLFSAIATASKDKKGERISSVQAWSDRAIDIEDAAALEAAARLFEARAEELLSQPALARRGFQLRALAPTMNGWRCVESSYAFDHTPLGRLGKLSTGTFHPIRRDTLMALCDDFMARVRRARPEMADSAARFDAMQCQSYRASRLSPSMLIGSARSPLAALCSQSSSNAVDAQRSVIGSNVAARGIVELTMDEAPMSREWVQRLYVNGHRQDVRSVVRAFDGGLVIVPWAMAARPDPGRDGKGGHG